MKRRITGSAKPNRTSLKRKSIGNVSLSSVDGRGNLLRKAETTHKLIIAHIAVGVDEDTIEEDLRAGCACGFQMSLYNPTLSAGNRDETMAKPPNRHCRESLSPIHTFGSFASI
jgi:hypothetical protein